MSHSAPTGYLFAHVITGVNKTGQWVAGSTKDAWKEHVRGLAALIELCGPGAFRHETMRQAFDQARGHIVSTLIFLVDFIIVLHSNIFDYALTKMSPT
jgi:hypothetical protein